MRKINELGRSPNNVFRLVRKMKVESTDAVGGRCMRGNDGTLYLNVKDRAKLLKACISLSWIKLQILILLREQLQE